MGGGGANVFLGHENPTKKCRRPARQKMPQNFLLLLISVQLHSQQGLCFEEELRLSKGVEAI